MIKRQFIAGATCPSCGAIDKIQRCEEQGKTWMECVACGMVRDLDAPPPDSDADVQTVELKFPEK